MKLSWAALFFVLLAAGLYVFPHGQLDAGRFVVAVPFAAIAFVVLAVASRLLGGRGSSQAARMPRLRSSVRRRGNPMAGMVIGGLGLIGAGIMSAGAERDASAYRSDAACQAGFSAVPSAGSICRLASARITRAYHSGKHATPTLTLVFSDGSTARAVVARNLNGDLWQAARDGSARAATAQFDGPHVAMLQTAAGTIETTDYPQRRLALWTLVGALMGGIGLISAIAQLARDAF